jgi:hypothetical protein
MKKLLVVMLVLAMASVANAALSLWMTVDGSVVTELTIATGDTVVIALVGDGTAAQGVSIMGIVTEGTTGSGTLSLDSAVITYVGKPSSVMTAFDNGDSFDWTPDGDGVEFVLTNLPPPGPGVDGPAPLDGILVDSMVFTCTGTGDVILALGDSDFGLLMDSAITIHQVTPEPMTMALLGLGGLFLRRRSK